MFSWRAFSTDSGAPGAALVIPSLERTGIRAAFTARAGGTSDAPFDSLNLSFVSGDEPERVRANRERALRAIGAPSGAWTSGRQVHGNVATRVEDADRGKGAEAPETSLPDTDALWTDTPGVALAVLTADCVPILLADPERRRIAVVHAGWRGLVAGVVERATTQMGGAPVAFVGPAIGPCCYVVGADVAEQINATFGDVVRDDGGIRADLWRAARSALQRAGISQVANASLCTRCEPHRFFSHRAGHAARQGLVAMIG